MNEVVLGILFYFAAIDQAMPAQIAQYELEFQAVTSIASQATSDKVSLCAYPPSSKLGLVCQLVTLRTSRHIAKMRNLLKFYHIFSP